MNKLIAYAADYVSFLLLNLPPEEADQIRSIILFGSVARGDYGKDSDVDLFIDVRKHTKGMERRLQELDKAFFASAMYKDYWSMLGVTNVFRAIAGDLEQWADVRESILANGIVLYGPYRGIAEKQALKMLFTWDVINDASKRVHLDKKLFGFRAKGKAYPGLVASCGGEKLGPRCVLAPAEHHRTLLRVFRDMRIVVHVREVAE
ncbi:MAG: nucleotidyltransferase domain-containing protein [Candidatus Aenigmarchaeota archaeon]|nr:nucleotidyltransferase domain-containing protein [Candidatus Aenigmarchaeota archaeon]